MRLPFARPIADQEAADLYADIVREARRAAWYAEAGVEDSMDGRFAVLATVLALTDLRLDRGGEEARAIAPRLAECFIADMDAQMREAGFGDPSLGKQVRHLVGALASRIDRWRQAIDGRAPWDEAAARSLYRETPPGEAARQSGIAMTKAWWARLEAAEDRALAEGRAP